MGPLRARELTNRYDDFAGHRAAQARIELAVIGVAVAAVELIGAFGIDQGVIVPLATEHLVVTGFAREDRLFQPDNALPALGLSRVRGWRPSFAAPACRWRFT